MHLPDGQLSTPLALGSLVVGGGLTLWSAARLEPDRVPRVALLSSAFFVSSLIFIPMPTGSVHLSLGGLLGLVLGRDALVATALGLVLQATLFGHGGLSALGVNLLAMATPGMLLAMILRRWCRDRRASVSFAAGAVLGALSAALSAGLIALAVILSDPQLTPVYAGWTLLQLPVCLIEGVITGQTAAVLARMRPELLDPPNTGSIAAA
jgi:cobalt/nickel transport system permease protein